VTYHKHVPVTLSGPPSEEKNPPSSGSAYGLVVVLWVWFTIFLHTNPHTVRVIDPLNFTMATTGINREGMSL